MESAIQRPKRIGLQTFASNSDDGRLTTAGNGYKRMEIRIQRDDNPPIYHGMFENQSIARGAHTNCADMERIPPTRPENSGSLARQALVQQKPYQTASRRTTSSSM